MNRNIPRLSEEELDAVKRRMGRGGVDRHAVQANSCMTPGKALQLGARRLIGKPVANPAPSPTLQSFFVPGPLPGANDIIRKHWRVYDQLKKHWGDIVQREIICAALKPMRACSITYHWVERTPRRGRIRDRDNIRFGAKFINDALVSQRILEDDGPDGVVSLTDTFAYNAVNPGVLVTLMEQP